MSARELVVLGTSSQVPTRDRNHNGYLLRWDTEGFLFDPGEGTQRQMVHAGVAASDITRVCVTHFHGDHCLGVAGIVQRLSLDRVAHPVTAHYPAEGAEFFARMRHASEFHEAVDLIEVPVTGTGPIADTPAGTLHAARLDHGIPAYGYRLVEPDGRRMLPDRLAEAGVTGPAISSLQRDGVVRVGDRVVEIDEVSEPRPGQRFAFVMDTRLCEAVYHLADGVDMLVIESTYLDADAALAAEYGHMTAAQAGRVAAACNVRTLLLTHFSQRYPDPAAFAAEAAAHFGGETVAATDLARVPVPRRRNSPPAPPLA